MPAIEVNELSLEFEDRGDPSDPVILLIMGLGRQLVAWPESFVNMLVHARFRVIRYDNRDVGRSTWIDGDQPMSPAAFLSAQRLGQSVQVPYTLTDMTDDALGLMDGLGLAVAHIVGVSMGGMIAQIMAAKAPSRVLTLTSMMSSSGAPDLPGATPEVHARLFEGPPDGATREQLLEYSAETLRLISYPDPARPGSQFRTAVELAAERGYNRRGYIRQLLAILADGSRVQRLSTIKAPTLVIHGKADPLIPVACGVDTARRISNARLEVIDHMAHDLPPSQISTIASLIIEHALSNHESVR